MILLPLLVINLTLIENNMNQRLSEIQIVQRIKENAEKGYYPHDGDVAQFVREIIPYLEALEQRLDKIERKVRTPRTM